MRPGSPAAGAASLALMVAVCLFFLSACAHVPTTPQNLSSYGFVTGNSRDIVKDGTWFRDAQGRYALFRGVNFGSRSKLPPYLPILSPGDTVIDAARFDRELNAVKPELVRLKSIGINVVRIPVMWKAIEPSPSPFTDRLQPQAGRYLAALKRIIDELYYMQGIYVLLDFHQDIAHEVYGGDGFPDWALAVDDQHPVPDPPSDLRDAKWGSNYYDIPLAERAICWCGGKADGVRHTLQSFWEDRLFNANHTETDRVINTAQNPRTHLERTIGLTAKYFMDATGGNGHPGILGYEPFNEPHQAGIAKQDFERRVLPGFYTRAATEIRKYDDKSFVFVEPRVDWTTYDANGPEYQGLNFTLTHQSFLPSPFLDGERAVFSFHYYDPWMVTGFPFARNMHDKVREWPGVFQRLRGAAESRGLIPFLTEFGCSQDWKDDTDLRPDIYQRNTVRACMDLQYQQVEAQVLNSMYWNYDLYNTAQDNDNWNLENFSLLGPNRAPRHLDIVARPYPQRSSARPLLISFDLASKNASILLQGQPVAEPTVIFVPRTTHYGTDFEVRATSGNVIWDEASQLLYWLPDSARTQNAIFISPRGGFNSSVFPAEAQAMLPEATFSMVVGAAKRNPEPL